MFEKNFCLLIPKSLKQMFFKLEKPEKKNRNQTLLSLKCGYPISVTMMGFHYSNSFFLSPPPPPPQKKKLNCNVFINLLNLSLDLGPSNEAVS